MAGRRERRAYLDAGLLFMRLPRAHASRPPKKCLQKRDLAKNRHDDLAKSRLQFSEAEANSGRRIDVVASEVAVRQSAVVWREHNNLFYIPVTEAQGSIQLSEFHFASRVRINCNSRWRFASVLGKLILSPSSVSRTIRDTINRAFSLSSAGTTYQGA